MTQVKEWSNQELNRKLAELMGYRVEVFETYSRLYYNGRDSGWLPGAETAWNQMPDYSSDPAASLEVQTAAIAEDADGYVQNLAIVKWGEPGDDVEDVSVWNKTMRKSIAELLTATPPREGRGGIYHATGGER